MHACMRAWRRLCAQIKEVEANMMQAKAVLAKADELKERYRSMKQLAADAEKRTQEVRARACAAAGVAVVCTASGSSAGHTVM